MLRLTLLALLLVGLVLPAGAGALELEEVYAPDPDDPRLPTYVTSDPGDPNRLFVLERTGKIQLVENGQVSTFLDLESIVMSPPDPGALDDHGLFSMAFSPDFATDHLFYVAYSGQQTTTPGDTSPWHLSEFQVEGGADGDTADPASRRDVLTIDYPPAQLHYAGQLQFGPGGYLYASTGDGGPQRDPDGNSQDPGNLYGKILRIDPRGSDPGEYSVPADNPFVGEAGMDEIWSYGLRNPWRFSFDSLTGDLVIGDVGYEDWEEVDFDDAPDAGKGLNFGWNCFEGTHPLATDPPCDAPGPLSDPAFEYPHVDGRCSSVTGGYVVRDPSLGDLYGRYLYADWCVGELRSLDLESSTIDRDECLEVFRPISFGEDSASRIYVTALSGEVYRLTAAGPDPCLPDDPPPTPTPPPPPGDSVEPSADSAATEPDAPPFGPAPLADAVCNHEPATITGSGASETLRGTRKRDIIAARGGRDMIRGSSGDDIICGGRGRDTLRGGHGADGLFGGPGGDRLLGGIGPDLCDGGAGRDLATGCPIARRL